MSIIEDSILAPFTDYILKRAAERGLSLEVLKKCLQDARQDMEDDHFVKVMETALEGSAQPSPMFEVSDLVAIFELSDPRNPPAIGERVGFSHLNGLVRVKDGGKSCGVLISIEPGGRTAQVMLDKDRR